MSDDKIIKDIPYLVYESTMARMERTVRRIWILCIVLVILLFGTNLSWVIYESQFVDEVVTQDVDTGDGAAYVAGIGDVYGTSETDYTEKSS